MGKKIVMGAKISVLIFAAWGDGWGIVWAQEGWCKDEME